MVHCSYNRHGWGVPRCYALKGIPMTINITGIYVDEPAAQKPNPIDQFWTAAGEVLIEIAKPQPHIHQVIGHRDYRTTKREGSQ